MKVTVNSGKTTATKIEKYSTEKKDEKDDLLPPITRELKGIIKKDVSENEYKEYLEEKYL